MATPIEPLTTAALSAALDAATRRHEAIASNIANANVEGYAPLRLAFDARREDARAALRDTGSLARADLDALRGALQAETDLTGQPGRIQLDLEMAELARNAVGFQTLTQALSRHLGILALAAADGRK